MATATARVVVLMAPEEKAELEAKARRAGLSVGAYLRRKLRAEQPEPDQRALDALLERLEASHARALAALERAERELAATEAHFRRVPDHGRD